MTIGIMDPVALLHKYLDPNRDLFEIVYRHSRSVADFALAVLDCHPSLAADRQFVEQASLLHDIGCVKTNAPSICCYGTEPYIRHGVLGAEILRAEGLPRHARVCERHTGTGLTLAAIESQQLPLPFQDLSPETLEEELICFADKFFSKTKLDRQRSVSEARQKLEKFGPESLARFDNWCERFL